MLDYNRTVWQDHIVDMSTGEVIQEGTPIAARPLNNIEEGVASVTEAANQHATLIGDLRSEVEILKNASLNNLTSNVFLENFANLDSIKLSTGIYDTAAKKIYV
ncbi:inorganic polyphosphate kinase [Paenibacillus sp. M1]|uniref:Inorganic polyphosphate kinase n=1 Tax=Paenibacillus haidiansis TaxID=1574488 RepID=A0ABU7VPK2_9BACL